MVTLVHTTGHTWPHNIDSNGCCSPACCNLTEGNRRTLITLHGARSPNRTHLLTLTNDGLAELLLGDALGNIGAHEH